MATATRRRSRTRRRAAIVLLLAILAVLAGWLLWLRLGSSSIAGAWAAGACRRLGPTGHSLGYTIYLDPGHGDPDPGTHGTTPSGATVYEKDLTLATAQRLSTILRADGYTVVMSRTRDSSVARLSAADAPGGVFSVTGQHKDIVARVDCANAAHARLLVSLHFNGYDDPSVGGAETFYDDARPFSDQNLKLAQSIQESLIAQFQAAGWTIPDRGAAPDSSDDEPTLTAQAAAYTHLLLLGPAQPGYLDHPSTMPGVLVEPLFLTDPVEAGIAASAAGQDAIARGVARGIEQFVRGAGD